MTAMARILVLFATLWCAKSQGVSEETLTIFEALTRTLECGKFQSVIVNGGISVQNMYKSTQQLTLFVPNNTAFDLANPELRQTILALQGLSAGDYVKSFTVSDMMDATVISPDLVKPSLASNRNNLFFYSRQRRREDIVNPGSAGRTEYYVNGALIIEANIRALNGIVHIIDRVLPQSSSKYIQAYLQAPNSLAPQTPTKFFELFLEQIDPEDYSMTMQPLSGSGPLTFFLPTDKAINDIPADKISNLQGQKKELARVIRQHMIMSKALYMSFLYHNEGYASHYGTMVIFRKNLNDQYYVSSGRVTAEISGNLTVANGVIHFVDKVLGFVYFSAREQVQGDTKTREFEQLLNRGRKDLRDFLVVPSGVTVFVPIDSAFAAVQNLPEVDLNNNFDLINKVLELSMLERGTQFQVTEVNGDYESRRSPPSQYRNYDIQVYSQGNETWVEGGYVKARVVRPDIGVTNGLVHYIDGVFGVPSRDLPTTVYCEDWLLTTSFFMGTTGLNTFMKDHRIQTTPPACPDSEYRRNIHFTSSNPLSGVTSNYGNTASSGSRSSTSLPDLGCGSNLAHCEFTMFVPNGTAMEFFQLSRLGQTIMADLPRFQYVMRRHIVLNQKIYLDQRAQGYHSFTASTGEEIRFKKVVAGLRVFYSVYFRGRRFTVLHADIGATNGVIHILDEVLHSPEDVYVDITGAGIRSSGTFLLSVLSVVLALIIR